MKCTPEPELGLNEWIFAKMIVSDRVILIAISMRSAPTGQQTQAPQGRITFAQSEPDFKQLHSIWHQGRHSDFGLQISKNFLFPLHHFTYVSGSRMVLFLSAGHSEDLYCPEFVVKK